MSSNLQFESSQDYVTAGVRINVGLNKPEEAEQSAFSFTVDNLETGHRMDFSHQACAAVHDFTRGYTRWLATKGIDTTLSEDEISGTVRGDALPVRLQQLLQEALDMADQKFSSYKGPIIGSTGYSDIVFEKRDGVAWLLINRPETYNAKRGITMNEMAEALLDAAGDTGVRAVVISGAGPNGFCTGNDQSYDPDMEQAEYQGTAAVSYSEVIRQMPQPVIAAVDGFAIGSGNILAYESDFTIATTRSRFGQTGPRVGSPAAGHTVASLAARIGQKRAREMWMLCRQYTAQEAYEMGLVNKVVEHAQLWEEVDRWIADIKRVSPVILQMQKISYSQHDQFIFPEKSPVQEYIPDYVSSEECRERRLAFIERRPIDQSKNMPYVPIPIK